MTFLDQLAQNCRRYAAKPALEFVTEHGVTAVSYHQLEQTVSQTMSFLQANGVQRGDRIAFQAAQRKERRGILKRMQQEGHEDGLYAVTDGAIPPPADQWRFRSSSTHVLSSEAR